MTSGLLLWPRLHAPGANAYACTPGSCRVRGTAFYRAGQKPGAGPGLDQAWDSLRDRYDEQFFRMWRSPVSERRGFCAGGNQLWQIVFFKDGKTGGYAAENIR